mgnify:CR=1 FL=1
MTTLQIDPSTAILLSVWSTATATAINVLVALICICRMNALLSTKHRLVIRLKYVVLFTLSVGGALAPWAFPVAANLSGALLGAGMVMYLLLSALDWQHGPPVYTETDWATLNNKREDCNHEQTDLFCACVGKPVARLWCRLGHRWEVVKRILRHPS